MLEVIDVHKSFGPVHAVDGVSFSLKPGTILGLVGKNGAGKSTLFRIILNILEPDKGDVLFNNTKYTIPLLGFRIKGILKGGFLHAAFIALF